MYCLLSVPVKSIAITTDIIVAGIAHLNSACSCRHHFKCKLYVRVCTCRCASHVVRRSLPVISRATACVETACTTGARHVISGNAKRGVRGSVMSPPTRWLAACSRSVCVCVCVCVCTCVCVNVSMHVTRHANQQLATHILYATCLCSST